MIKGLPFAGANTSTTESPVVATTVPVLPTCINGKVFETCGTACPLTCDNYRSPPFACPAVCAQGCFCPHGLVELGDTCVPPTSCPGKLLKEWGSSYLYYVVTKLGVISVIG